MITEQLISYETARLAREKGFNEVCRHVWEWYEMDGKEYGPVAIYYSHIDIRELGPETFRMFRERPYLYEKTCGPKCNADLPPYLFSRPTQDLLERWMREVHGIECETNWARGDNDTIVYTAIVGIPKKEYVWYDRKTVFPKKELAREIASMKGLNQIK